MTSPHDRPTASELIESVREWLEKDVARAVDGRLSFHTRVAINSLNIVLRELEDGEAMSSRHRDVLKGLGVQSDSELSKRIRAGEFDTSLGALLTALEPVITDKVAVANPNYLLS